MPLPVSSAGPGTHTQSSWKGRFHRASLPAGPGSAVGGSCRSVTALPGEGRQTLTRVRQEGRHTHTRDKRAGTHTRAHTPGCFHSLAHSLTHTHTAPLQSLKLFSPKPKTHTYRQFRSLQLYSTKLKLKRCNPQSQPKSKDQKRLYPLPISLSSLFFFPSSEIQSWATLIPYADTQNVNITTQHPVPFLINKVTNIFAMQA